MQNLVGSHYLLANIPVWATAFVLLSLTIGILHIGRAAFEGLSYNVAFSSEIGDVALVVVVLIGATILQRGVYLPGWASSWVFHTLIGIAIMPILGALFGSLLALASQRMDIYHHLVVMPLFIYLLGSLVPVLYIGATQPERIAVVCLVLLWFFLLVFDVATGRLDQRKYIKEQGVVLS